MPTSSPALLPALEALCAATDAAERLARDPLSFPRRYTDPADVEVAAVFAASLAYGRVSLFFPVLHALFNAMDARGGPARFARTFGAADAAALAPLLYRWNRHPDFSLLALSLGAALDAHGSLGALFQGHFIPEAPDLAPSLEGAVSALRAFALARAPRLGLAPVLFADLPRGFRTFLPLPSEKSACKRWNMLLRWMVRRPGPARDGQPLRADGVDLGLWDLPPEKLIIPLDTHVARLAWLLGLTDRQDGSWRTAAEITAALRNFDAADPVRFDFALAHLGISGQCEARPVPSICGPCPLRPTCRVGAQGSPRGAPPNNRRPAPPSLESD